MRATRRPEWMQSLRRLAATNGDLLANATALMGTTVVTSVLGAAFWAFAARLFAQSTVGYASAGISAMMLFSTIGMLGLNTVLIIELAKRRPQTGGLVAASLLTSAGVSGLMAAAFVLIGPLVTESVPYVSTPATAATFVIGAAVTAAALVLDEALIGALLGSIQMWRNAAASALKLALLAALAVLLHDQYGTGILATWVIATLLSLTVSGALLQRKRMRLFHQPQWGMLSDLRKSVNAHNWLNLAMQAPRLAMPVLVTAVVSPRANAVFYAAWLVVSFLFIVPTHLSTVLFAIGAADRELLRDKMRFTLRLSFLLGPALVLVLIVGAHWVLNVFGEDYSVTGTLPLQLLTLSYFPVVIRAHYVAVCRVRGRVGRAAAVMAIGSIVDMVAAAIGGVAHGLVGLSLGLLVARYVQSAFVTAPVVRALRFHSNSEGILDVQAGAGRHESVRCDIDIQPLRVVTSRGAGGVG